MVKRYRSLLVTIFALLFFPFCGPLAANAGPSENGIHWVSYEDGIARGAQEGKKLLVIFNTDWCTYCHKMAKETFVDSAVVAYVNRNFIPVSVNADQRKEIAAEYGVSSFPFTWFVSNDGQRIASRPGFVSADEMIKILRYIGSDSYLTISFKTFINEKHTPHGQ